MHSKRIFPPFSRWHHVQHASMTVHASVLAVAAPELESCVLHPAGGPWLLKTASWRSVIKKKFDGTPRDRFHERSSGHCFSAGSKHNRILAMAPQFDPQGAANFSFPTTGAKVGVGQCIFVLCWSLSHDSVAPFFNFSLYISAPSAKREERTAKCPMSTQNAMYCRKHPSVLGWGPRHTMECTAAVLDATIVYGAAP